MAYGLKYYFEFEDEHPVSPVEWRVELLRNGYTGSATEIPFQDIRPLVIEQSGEEEEKFTPMIGSKASVTYCYDGESDAPIPEEFINITEDDYQMVVYRGGSLYWKGFVKPDNAQYPWVPAPFTFKINATDYFNGFRGIEMDLNKDGIFYYGFFTLGEFIQRTIFHAVGYDVAVNVLYNISPDVISGNIMEDLYLHTDAFYTIDKGADTVYDALKKVMLNLGARLFYSAGEYWIQRIADIGSSSYNVIRITPGDLEGTLHTITDVSRNLPGDVFFYEMSQILRIDPGIKRQDFKYEIKGLNRVKNFKWDDVAAPPSSPDQVAEFNGPNPGSGMEIVQTGTGTTDDPHGLYIFGTGDVSIGAQISQPLGHIATGQYVELDLKAYVYYTTGQRFSLVLIPPLGGAIYYLTGDGDWTEYPSEILLTADKKSRLGTLSISSKKVPKNDGGYNIGFGIIGIQNADDPDDPVPPLSIPHNILLPVFVRIYNNLVYEVNGKVINNKRYSQTPDEIPMFFLDIADPNISNCIFYNASGTMKPLPVNNWGGKSIDERMGLSRLDQYNEQSYVFEGDILTNSLQFHQHLVMGDAPLAGKKMLAINDSYDVKAALHSVLYAEIKDNGTGDGTYSTTSKSK